MSETKPIMHQVVELLDREVGALRKENTELKAQLAEAIKERNAFQDQCIRLKRTRNLEFGQLSGYTEEK